MPANFSLSDCSIMFGRTIEIRVRKLRPNMIAEGDLLVPVCGMFRYVRRNSMMETARGPCPVSLTSVSHF